MFSRLGTIVLLVVWIGQVVCIAPVVGAEAGRPRCTAWVQVEDWRGLVIYQAQRLALGQRRGRRRGRGWRIRQIRRRRRRRRLPVAVWRRLKPVLAELVQEETVRQTGGLVGMEAQSSGLSAFRVPVQVVVVTPDYRQTPCSDCGGPTKCKRSYYIHPQDIDLERPTILQVYREVRECCDPTCEGRTAPELDFVESGRTLHQAGQGESDCLGDRGWCAVGAGAATDVA